MGDEIGYCDVCNEPYDTASSIDHCGEEGLCWDDCTDPKAHSVDTGLKLDYDGSVCYTQDTHDDCNGWLHCGPGCCGYCSHCGI